MNLSDGLDCRRILVIATGHALSLALLDGDQLLAEHHEPIGRGHAEALMPALGQLLAAFGGPQTRVDEIIVETGPGSFTGLRIGLAAAQALGLAWDVPVHGVRSTQLAESEARAGGVEGALLVALAAPRGQIWSEWFDEAGVSRGPPIARMPEDICLTLPADISVAGSASGLLGRPAGGPPRAAAFCWRVAKPRQPAELLYVREGEH